MSIYNVFLDDIREPRYIKNILADDYPDEWVVIRDYFQFTKFIDENIKDIKLVSFDHDLASYDNEKEWTGKDACDYLINKCIDENIPLPDWIVHTQNISGRPNIISSILTYLKYIENKDINFQYFNNGLLNNKIV